MGGKQDPWPQDPNPMGIRCNKEGGKDEGLDLETAMYTLRQAMRREVKRLKYNAAVTSEVDQGDRFEGGEEKLKLD